MPRRPPRRKRLQNAAFLAALRRTGNARLAARELAVHRSTYLKRRARDPVFAAGWDRALAAAHAAFRLAGGERPPETAPPPRSSRAKSRGARADSAPPRPGATPELKTKGGEPTVVRLNNGRFQLRLAPPGRMTAAAEQAFLAALSASANVRLSAAAAGFAHSSFYVRARRRHLFGREMRLALTIGYDRVEAAVLAAGQEGGSLGAWQRSPPRPVPPLTADQAIQLLATHRNTVRLGWETRCAPFAPRIEFDEAMAMLARGIDVHRRAWHFHATGSLRLPEEDPAPPKLPPLELVTGWSRSKGPKAVHNPDLALFGGWRLKDWEKRRKAG